MPKIPKQRGGGGFGGSGHGESKFRSVRRGGRPSSGRAKGGLCAAYILAGSVTCAVPAGALVSIAQHYG